MYEDEDSWGAHPEVPPEASALPWLGQTRFRLKEPVSGPQLGQGRALRESQEAIRKEQESHMQVDQEGDPVVPKEQVELESEKFYYDGHEYGHYSSLKVLKDVCREFEVPAKSTVAFDFAYTPTSTLESPSLVTLVACDSWSKSFCAVCVERRGGAASLKQMAESLTSLTTQLGYLEVNGKVQR